MLIHIEYFLLLLISVIRDLYSANTDAILTLQETSAVIPSFNNSSQVRNESNIDFNDPSRWVTPSSTSHYFLSTSESFGKEVLMDAFKCFLLESNDAGVCVYKENYQRWNSYPVLYIDMSSTAYQTTVEFKISLKEKIINLYDDHQSIYLTELDKKKMKATSYNGLLKMLIYELSRQKGMNVVLLIEGYDAPVRNTTGSVAEGNLKTLRRFFNMFSRSLIDIKIIFITGVDKNVLWTDDEIYDLSQKCPIYSTIMGFSGKELRVFLDKCKVLMS